MASGVRPLSRKNVVYIEGDIPSPSTPESITPPARLDILDTVPAVNAEAEEYYGGRKVYSRTRTLSNAGTTGYTKSRPVTMDGEFIQRNRRLSHDEIPSAPRRFLVDVEETMRLVLAQEDTDNNCQISIHDSGPKLISLGTASSNAYRTWDVRGNYMLSNLLQELALARDYGRRFIVLDEARLAENPVDRLSRMIKNSFWNALTRRIDAQGIEQACSDPKNRSRVRKARIYVPHTELEMLAHYQEIAKERPDLNLDVIQLPPVPDDPMYVKSLNDKPGILALAMEKGPDGKLQALPFVVPGARFNEMYNWDSYFIALALLVDGRLDLAMAIVEHFMFQIKHYNKILNGNRTYYLCRAQPPFMTDLALQIFNQLDRSKMEENKKWLKRAIQSAIKEYHRYWMVEPSLDPVSGLSRYRPKGLGIPPETEASHFTHILEPYAKKRGISVNEFIEGYNDGVIKEPELDEYFLHDRGVRESGHDTTYRLEKKCADLATVDLNALLYKYEIDIASAIECLFDDSLDMEETFDLSPWPITPETFASTERIKSTDKPMTSAEWYERARVRKARMDEYCWNEGKSMYFDYNTKRQRQSLYESVTTFWPMWAGCASEDQALRMMKHSLPKFEMAGGLVSGTLESRGAVSLDRPHRQWDYSSGWPPHQILAWVGMERYGFMDEAARLAYRWVYMMTTTFVDFNGIVAEKFDVVYLTHNVEAEYGNQGLDFRYVNREGFGWSNASMVIGTMMLTPAMRRAVAACIPPWDYFGVAPPDYAALRAQDPKLVFPAHAHEEEDAPTPTSSAGGHRRTPSDVRNIPTLQQTIAQLKGMQM